MKKDGGYAFTIKKHVDFLYDLTKDGYDGSMSSFKSATLTKVASELIKRGVISKKRIVGVRFSYRWNASMAPTEHFYLSVAKALSEHQREIDKGRRMKTAAMNTSAPVNDKTLSDYSIQELWDELKKRGVQVEDGRLVVIQKTYFE